MTKLYETDYYGWTKEQAELLKRRSANELDWDLLSQELDALGATEERELESRYIVLLMHLLKWIYQPEKRSRSWQNSIINQRKALAKHFRRNPGLKPLEAETFAEAYDYARRDASTETDLDIETFPETPPFSIDEAKDDAFWPD